MSLRAVPCDPNEPCPMDISLTRVLERLGEIGHHAETVVEGRAAGAVLNSTPFLFSVDGEGRFLSIRALWDAPLDPAEHGQHLFAATDEWNRSMYFPTAYWMCDESGDLQICTDFTVDARAGLTDEQLDLNLEAGISTGIEAITFLREALGTMTGAVPPGAGTSVPGSD